ncbi:hypothetical protein LTR66_011733 [Elasticomyces elasticus]|nr:hypothetical protein LTR66_011733 [Elasticomyces elasticus]
MDRQTQPREMVFCHQCENEWYRDEHGLVCPDCESEFTEIIEANHDPREPEHDDISLPQGHHMHNHPTFGHDPGADAPDPDEADISHFFSLHGTIHRSMTPLGGQTHQAPQQNQQQNRQQAGPFGGHVADNFFSMVTQMMGGPRQMPMPQQGRPQSPPDQPPDQANVHVRHGGGNGFTYTTTLLYPRDANHAQPPNQPVGNVGDLLGAFFGGMAPPGGAAPVPAGHGHNPDGLFGLGGPFGAIFASLMNPANAQHGDAVYTQEALDRIITQLMEQHQSGNAPGPASAEAIASLPKKGVDESMLDESGKAECSICMDEVARGEEVTTLPCTHWFHFECVKAWLSEHDTCPQCRAGIMPKPDQNAHAQQQQQQARSPDQPPLHDPQWGQNSASTTTTTTIPGTYGSATVAHPWTLPDSPTRDRHPSRDTRRTSDSAGPSDSGGGSLISSMRRAFGGGGGSGNGSDGAGRSPR